MGALQPLHVWPEQAAAAFSALGNAAGLAVIGVATPRTENRAIARQALRTAVQNLLAQFWQCPAQSIQFSRQPGQTVALLGAPGHMQISFSHAPGLSVAALHRHQKIGVDILRADSVLEGGVAAHFAPCPPPALRAPPLPMQTALPPRLLGDDIGLLSDWEQLAHDYLGPAAHLHLKSSHVHTRARLFAQQWSDLEAGLKCLGLGLQEWSPEVQSALDGCYRVPLVLPGALAMEFCGSVALQPLAHPAAA